MAKRFVFGYRSILPVALCGAAFLAAGCATPERVIEERLAALRKMQFIPAQPSETVKGPLTIDEAIERAIAYSEEVSVLRSDADVAAYSRLAAGDRRDPVLGLTYSEDQTDTTSRRWDYTSAFAAESVRFASDEGSAYAASMRFYPQNPFERHYRIAAAAYGSRAASYDLRNSEWTISIEVRRLFAELDYLKRDIALLDELVSLTKESLDFSKEMLKNGQSTAQDLMTASRTYLGALSDRNEAGMDFDAARETLAAYVGLPAGSLEIAVDENTFPRPVVAGSSADKLARNAFADRPDLSALAWRTKAARAAYRETLATRLPWPIDVRFTYSENTSEEEGLLGANVFGRPLTSPLSFDEMDGSEWRIDTIINVPIFSWINHDADVRLAEYRRARTLETAARQRIYRDIKNALGATQTAEKRLLTYRAEVIPLVFDMQQVLDSVEDAGGILASEAARLKRELFQTERLKLQTELQYRLTVIHLERVLGSSLESSRPRDVSTDEESD